MGKGTNREHKEKVLQECVAFYQKSIGMFQQNVNNKLRSLVDNVDFSQL